MAKKSVSFVEKHVEKAVLGAVVAVFGWVAYSYLLTSPNKVEWQGSTVGPSEIDRKVKETADRVYDSIRRHRPDPVEVPDFPGQIERLAVGPLRRQDAKVEAQLPRSVHFGAPVPNVVGPGKPGQVVLASLIAPDQPRVAVGRISALFPPRSVPIGEQLSDRELNQMEIEGPQDRSWATVVARFDLQRQQRAFLENNYQTSRFKVVTADVLLQRQQRLADGNWSEWVDVEDFNEYYMDPPPELKLEDSGDEAIVPPFQRDALKVWYENLIEFEQDLVRPWMPVAEFGTQWQPPSLEDLARVYPDEGFVYTPPKDPVTKRRTKRAPLRQAREDLDTTIPTLIKQEQLEEALSIAEGILNNSKIPSRNPVKERATQFVDELQRLIKEKELARLQKPKDAPDAAPEERTEELYLAHDLTAPPGIECRYRLKIRAFNQYATIVDRLKDPQQATEIYIDSAWSDPTASVVIPPQQRIYLARAKVDNDRREARFDVFKWYKGQWVDAQLTTDVGDPITGAKRVTHATGKIVVDFDFRARLVDLEIDKPYVVQRPQRDGSIVTEEPENTVAAICQSEGGELFEVIALAGQTDPERRQIEEEIKEFRKKKVKRSEPPSRNRRPPRGGGGGGGGRPR